MFDVPSWTKCLRLGLIRKLPSTKLFRQLPEFESDKRLPERYRNVKAHAQYTVKSEVNSL